MEEFSILINEEFITEMESKYPKLNIKFGYGTCGFRTKSDTLENVCFRSGIIAALRSKCVGQICGIVITASHNGEQDNGIKLVEPTGTMLDQTWESICEDIINTENILGTIKNVVQKVGLKEGEFKGHIFMGYDTRKSSPHLAQLAKEGMKSIYCECTDFGLVTTPMLHFLTMTKNFDPVSYYDFFSKQFEEFIKCLDIPSKDKYQRKICLDGADGIGGLKFIYFQDKFKEYFDVKIINDSAGEEVFLNNKCGAEYVQKEKLLPRNFGKDFCNKWVSFDGDADRIVYFFETEGELRLIDGDKITSIVSTMIQRILSEEEDGGKFVFDNLKIGAVQTAYANSAATKYIRNQLCLNVEFAATGVKYCHGKAEESDIGMYFEPNGHGTILVKFHKLDALLLSHPTAPLNKLKLYLNLANQAVGDAMALLLLIEVSLMYLNWSIQDWFNLYKDYPSRMTKQPVKDKSVFKPIPDETKLAEPAAFQTIIEQFAAKYEDGRAFVRPSGTEDVVRVYAETITQQKADELAKEIVDYIDANYS